MSIDTLRGFAEKALPHSHTPYSGQPRSAVALMSNGDWISGVRIENSSYSLVIPAFTAALVSARLGRPQRLGRHRLQW